VLDPTTLALPWALALFAFGTVLIAVAGSRLAAVADVLADMTGMGEALAGSVFLGAVTSLAGITATLTTAAQGHPEFAVSHALGGIAIQTGFIGVVDVTYRRANLEHAAASLENMLLGVLLIVLLCLPLVAMSTTEFDIFAVHPVSAALPAVYVGGLMVVYRVRLQPMWRPRQTRTTVEDVPETDTAPRSPIRVWASFGVLATGVLIAGLALGQSGVAIAAETGLSETLVGAIFTTASSSLPEFVTSLGAVRQGALTLAVGNIIGGNAFDMMFVALADFAYRDGSVLHTLGDRHVFLIAWSMLLTAVLVLGLLRREQRGIGNIGLEGVLVLLIYFGGATVLFSQS
jgi:cation:H+ antiporter